MPHSFDARLGWPEVAILPVTYLCNASCDMCSLGDLKDRARLDDDRLVAHFAHPAISSTLRAVNFTGGEPTLRRDLAAFVGRIMSVCPQLESVSLNSNGMLPKSATVIGEVIAEVQRRGKKLYLFVSLDGIGPLHDEIRGVRGAFSAAVRTIDAIRALAVPPEYLAFGVSATATFKNIDHLREVLEFAVARDLLVSFTFPMSTGVYMNNLDRVERFHAAPEMVERFARFIDELEAFPDNVTPPMPFYRSLQGTLRGAKRVSPCIFQRGGFFLEPDGNLFPCWRSAELRWGSLRDESFAAIWRGERRRELLETIEERFCSSCPSPCYVGFESELLAPLAAST